MTERVDVYWNLHRLKWSVRSRETGRVVDHARTIVFPYGAAFIVQPLGHNRALLEGRKNVHAFVRGYAETSEDLEFWRHSAEALPRVLPVSYNPHRAAYFHVKGSGARIASASSVVMLAPEGEAPRVWAVPDPASRPKKTCAA